MTRIGKSVDGEVIIPRNILSEQEVDRKIQKLQGHIEYLENRCSSRNTHGGSKYRHKQQSLKEQISFANSNLAELQRVQHLFRDMQEKPEPEERFALGVLYAIGKYLLRGNS